MLNTHWDQVPCESQYLRRGVHPGRAQCGLGIWPWARVRLHECTDSPCHRSSQRPAATQQQAQNCETPATGLCGGSAQGGLVQGGAAQLLQLVGRVEQGRREGVRQQRQPRRVPGLLAAEPASRATSRGDCTHSPASEVDAHVLLTRNFASMGRPWIPRRWRALDSSICSEYRSRPSS